MSIYLYVQGEDPVVLMGTNNLIESRFEDTGRYQLLSPVASGDNLEFRLIITGKK